MTTERPELKKIRTEMDALRSGASNFPVNMTPDRLRRAGIPGRTGADQLAKYYGLTGSDSGGGYWRYQRS